MGGNAVGAKRIPEKRIRIRYAVRNDIKPDELNEHSQQAAKFMMFMADALKNGVQPDDAGIKEAIGKHISYVNEKIHPTDARAFLGDVPHIH